MHQCFIDGQWVDGSTDRIVPDLDPFTGDIIDEFRLASLDDLDRAYRAAQTAGASWANVPAPQRRDILLRVAELITEHEAKIVETIIRELGGTPLKAGFEVGLAREFVLAAAELPFAMEGTMPVSPYPDAENRVYLDPVGVVGVISPSNFPFILGLKSVAPAIACGNGVVLKPHEDTPKVGGTIIAQLFQEAGLPPGVLNVVITDHNIIGDAFVTHPIPEVISFTGSAAVGQQVAIAAAREFKKCIIEAGGNSAFIVLRDADLDLAVDAAIFSRFTHSGQICMSANRMLIDDKLYDKFTARFVARAQALTVGDPRNERTIIGPVINAAYAARLDDFVQTAIAEGARVALPGKVDGNLVHPTVLADVTPNMTVAREEMFGPVVALMRFFTEDDAIAIANESRYGLSGAVHGGDIDHAVQFARQINTGMIHINDTSIDDQARVVFSGRNQSALGSLGGRSTLDAFTRPQWVSIQRGRRKFPY